MASAEDEPAEIGDVLPHGVSSDLQQSQGTLSRNVASPSNLDRVAQGGLDSPLEDDWDRENRFGGPMPTWNNFTSDEQALAASIDQALASDLGIHLYNAHAITARLYDQDAVSKAKPWDSKRTWFKPDEKGNLPWHPPPFWTAWPLPAADVPRPGEDFGKSLPTKDLDGVTWKKQQIWRPGGDLEDEVQALMLRTANRRFQARRKGDIEPVDHQNFHQLQFIADDDQASRILRPSARHILSKLDDLLLALHKSRAAQKVIHDTSNGQSRPLSRKRKRAGSKAGRLDARSSSSQQAASVSADDQITPEPWSDEARSRPFKVLHGTRDWSEVLGIAAMAGWDQAVVARAAGRCSSLFGEHMTFRKHPMYTDLDDDEVSGISVPHSTLDAVPQPQDEPTESRTEAPEYFFCPVEDCRGSGRPYPRNRRYRLRDHLIRVHKWNPDDVRKYADQLSAKGSEQ